MEHWHDLIKAYPHSAELMEAVYIYMDNLQPNETLPYINERLSRKIFPDKINFFKEKNISMLTVINMFAGLNSDELNAPMFRNTSEDMSEKRLRLIENGKRFLQSTMEVMGIYIMVGSDALVKIPMIYDQLLESRFGLLGVNAIVKGTEAFGFTDQIDSKEQLYHRIMTLINPNELTVDVSNYKNKDSLQNNLSVLMRAFLNDDAFGIDPTGRPICPGVGVTKAFLASMHNYLGSDRGKEKFYSIITANPAFKS